MKDGIPELAVLNGCNKSVSSLFVGRYNYFCDCRLSFILEGWAKAQGNSCTATIPDLLCALVLFLIIPDSSTRTLLQLLTEISSSEVGKTSRGNVP
jgi:hypothetical protein